MKEEIEKTIKRHLRGYLLIDRDASYDLNIPDGCTTARECVVERIMNEIEEVIEEK